MTLPLPPTQGTFGNVWQHFWLSQLAGGSATGIWWVETGDATKCPITNGTAPTTKNYLARILTVLNLRIVTYIRRCDLFRTIDGKLGVVREFF